MTIRSSKLPMLAALVGMSLSLFGCAPQVQSNTPTTIAAATGTPTPQPSNTPLPVTATSTPTASVTPQPVTGMYSPLRDVPLGDLTQILQEPMQTPHPGQDDGHHGVDFAFYRFGSVVGMEERPIQSVLNGIVAANVKDRQPYGNMVIIETPLEQVPGQWIDALHLPTPAPAMQPDSRMLNCPLQPVLKAGLGSGRSLYLLYAHMHEPSPLKPGDAVKGGDVIGKAGTTGKSVNTHLHLEVRVGPSGARFSSMAYYVADASAEEFANYCTWRISQIFQLLDPLKLLERK
jgi:murein DD-endopeptidase MepM/ murein hydrolase activator NlpD